MKTLFLLAICVVLSQPSSYKIVGSLHDCNPQEIEYGNRLIAISKDGKVLNDAIKTGAKGHFEIGDLAPGNYVIGYYNKFRQRVRKPVAVNAASTSVELCLDDFQDTNVSTLFNTMKNGDKLLLSISSHGCFHTFQDDLTFSLTDKKYSVSFTDEKNKVRTLPIDIAKLNELIRFEKIVRHMSKIDGGCTTTDGYVFTKNGEIVYQATDNTCEWRGVRKIRSEILGIK
ncbi:MAG: hypothetical protein EOO50_07605 [Flavobacterium sp.]|uniref:hypothetical protein n=1 Tax=Flavobacterium sp. TaxID=239 RepID=UPI00120FE4F3|nr:hypothetical protein [Flavobacterium sp.]RZJ66913.1 MAG: hypothetical protein EOO50_07605 [Flavobacterium sp.]